MMYRSMKLQVRPGELNSFNCVTYCSFYPLMRYTKTTKTDEKNEVFDAIFRFYRFL